jgi:hypothetical protein
MGRRFVGFVFVFVFAMAWPSFAEEEEEGPWLADRGPGIPTSLFGTYITKGEFLVYPFYEYTKNTSEEYDPTELGGIYDGKEEFMGTLVEHEFLLFLAYGISDWVHIELEGALFTEGTFTTAPDDPSNLPDQIVESGLGDVESQIRWRYTKESAKKPEYYSFFEVVFPLQPDNVVVGTSDWEYAAGFGVIKGFGWGTLNGRVSLKYDEVDRQVEAGEFAIEYLKRLNPKWRMVGTLEGEDDEISIIGEAQLFLNPKTFFKFNCGFGITEKAPNIAPEIGIMFSF